MSTGMWKSTKKKIKQADRDIASLHRGTLRGKRVKDENLKKEIKRVEKSIYKWKH